MQRDEFERLALDHLNAVYRLAFQLTRSRELAEDLVQDVYLRALKPGPSDRFEERANQEQGVQNPALVSTESIRAWLFTITHNAFYSSARKRLREQGKIQGFAGGADREGLAPKVGTIDDDRGALPECNGVGQEFGRIALGSIGDELPADLPPTWNLGGQDWDRVDQRLKTAVTAIKPEYRQALLLWALGGMKYREIATLLDVPIGTVMSRLHRARKLLADALGGPEGPATELGIRPSQLERARLEREDEP